MDRWRICVLYLRLSVQPSHPITTLERKSLITVSRAVFHLSLHYNARAYFVFSVALESPMPEYWFHIRALVCRILQLPLGSAFFVQILSKPQNVRFNWLFENLIHGRIYFARLYEATDVNHLLVIDSTQWRSLIYDSCDRYLLIHSSCSLFQCSGPDESKTKSFSSTK